MLYPIVAYENRAHIISEQTARLNMYLVTIFGVETDGESSFSAESEDNFLFTPAAATPAELIVDDGMAGAMTDETLKVGNASSGTNSVVGI